MSRKHAWDLALDDAIKVSYTDPFMALLLKAYFHS